MSEALFPYYERELLYLRQLIQEFARDYHDTANRLLIDQIRSADPHVERMIESFALVCGRVHHKLDDEFPELTEALLGVLYPHYLAPVPSLATVQFDLDPARAQLPEGFLIPRGSRLNTQIIKNQACRFRTAYPVTLWPVRLTMARLQSPPFPPGLQVPPRAAAAVRLQFETVGGLSFKELTLETLRFYLSGETHITPLFYELLFNHALQVVFRPMEPETNLAPLILRPDQTLGPVGFERDESLLLYSHRSLLGYRLLTEFFAFPGKFLYMDLSGWQRAALAGFEKSVEVVIFLNRTIKSVEQAVDASTFCLGCTPVVNLFEQVAEPIPLTPNRHEYRIVPDAAYSQGVEVYSVESVVSADATTGITTEYQPFHSIKHSRGAEERPAFWYTSRHKSTIPEDPGSDVILHLVDLSFTPRQPAARTLTARTICTNRDLPAHFQRSNEPAQFELEAAAPLARINCLRTPTIPLRPPSRRGRDWRLVSHLNLNHLSLTDPVEGLEGLQEILRLYDFSRPEVGQLQLSAVLRQLIDGIVSMKAQRVIGRPAGDFCRGIEVLLEFDEEKYHGTGVFLFAAVLERFLGLYVSVNSFSQLVGKLKQAREPFKVWPPRPGELPLV